MPYSERQYIVFSTFFTAAWKYNVSIDDLKDYLQILLGQTIFKGKNITTLLTTAQGIENALSAQLGHEVTNNDILQLLQNVSYQLEDLVIRCEYNGHPNIDSCLSLDFFTPIFTMMGKCYIFNFQQKAGVLYQPSIGAFYGVRIVIDIHQEQYSGNNTTSYPYDNF